MNVYEPFARTSVETIKQYGQLVDRGRVAEAASQAWTDARFEDGMNARWLEARCFDAGAARALAELGVTPEQAAVRTRDGGGGEIETIGWKVQTGT